MYVQSSPGFDLFSTSFIKHAEKTIQDDRGKRHTENVLLPLILTCFLCSCQMVSPHSFGTKSKLRLCTKKVQLRLQKITVCWLTMAVSMDFLQTCSKCCWRTGLLLNTKYQTHNLVSAPQGTQTNPSLFCDTFSLLRKRNKWRCSLLFWISLLPTTVFQERNFGDTCKKIRLHSIWEISFKPYYIIHRMPIPSHWWRQNSWWGCIQQRLETGLPSESPSVLPL